MSEFNYNEINKRAMAPNLLKSYGVEIEKAISAGSTTGTEITNKKTTGEALKKESVEKATGDRGGKVIGYTKSGKPIYSRANHESHASYTKEDHGDAAMLHRNLNRGLGQARGKAAEDQKLHHMSQSTKHDIASKKDNAVEKGKKLEVDTEEMIDEHKKLINTLESESKEDDKKEIKEQKKELEGYKEKLKKSFDILGIDLIEK